MLLLPYLLAGLKSSAHKDYRAATLMVLTQLCSKAKLSNKFLTGNMTSVVKPACRGNCH